ncbi:MAG: hypothetical protein L6262_01645 [Weeksellaceae bacterium]|nr:hypothetical protein [Weeksellaceae bacterium]
MNKNLSKYALILLLTFVIVFLMNYIGNDAPDKLSRALLTGFAAVVGLGIGLWIYSRRDREDDRNNFD